MCGIVGIMAEPALKTVRVFDDLLQIDVLRGADSTGAIVANTRGVEYMSEAALPQDMMAGPDYDKMTGRVGITPFAHTLMGHNRAATKGKINNENAHPFEHNGVLLMHNGTVHNLNPIKRDLEGDFDTDSETICHAVGHKGIKWAWERIDGAATLAYYDVEEKSMNLITNGKRPLCYAYTKDNKGIIYASEAWMIRGIAHRHSVELEENKVWLAAKDILLSYKWNVLKREVELTSRKLEGYVIPPTYHTGWYGRSNMGYDDTDYDGLVWSVKIGGWVQPEKKEEANITNLIVPLTKKQKRQKRHAERQEAREDALRIQAKQLVAKARAADVREKTITEEAFKKKYTNCVWCNDSLEHEYKEAVIINDTTAACDSCANIADLNNMQMIGT